MWGQKLENQHCVRSENKNWIHVCTETTPPDYYFQSTPAAGPLRSTTRGSHVATRQVVVLRRYSVTGCTQQVYSMDTLSSWPPRCYLQWYYEVAFTAHQ